MAKLKCPYEINGSKYAYPWNTVDWSKTNPEIAEELGCSRRAAAFARPRFAPPEFKESRYNKLVGCKAQKWKNYDFHSGSLKEIAEREGVSISAVARARIRHCNPNDFPDHRGRKELPIPDDIDLTRDTFDLCQEYGVSRSTIGKWRVKRGVKAPDRRIARYTVNHVKET